MYGVTQPRVVIVTGNPGVTERDPYPTRTKPQPVIRVGVSAGRGRGFGGFFLMLRVAGSQRVDTKWYITLTKGFFFGHGGLIGNKNYYSLLDNFQNFIPILRKVLLLLVIKNFR